MLEVPPKPPAFCVRFVIQVQFNRNHWHCEHVHYYCPSPCIDSMLVLYFRRWFWPASQLPENSIRQYDMDHVCAAHVNFAYAALPMGEYHQIGCDKITHTQQWHVGINKTNDEWTYQTTMKPLHSLKSIRIYHIFSASKNGRVFFVISFPRPFPRLSSTVIHLALQEALSKAEVSAVSVLGPKAWVTGDFVVSSLPSSKLT